MQLYHGDCLDVMKSLPSQSVDLILCDLPYGLTASPFDKPLNLNALWTEYRRLIRLNHAVVLFGSQPYTYVLIDSNFGWFKYEWIWIKNVHSGFAQAKNMPLKKHENILVFSAGVTNHAIQSHDRMPYYPQNLQPCSKVLKNHTNEACFAERKGGNITYEQTQTNYPNSVLPFDVERQCLHPTAKPIKLMEYLIKTFTLAGQTVLDNCMGSGSTGVAAQNTQREFIGIEKDKKFFDEASERLQKNQRRVDSDTEFFQLYGLK